MFPVSKIMKLAHVLFYNVSFTILVEWWFRNFRRS